MIKTGIVSATFRKSSPQKVLQLAVQAGVDGIEWSSDTHILPGDIRKAELMKRLCQEAGKEICGYASYYRLGEHPNPVSAFRPVMETAEALNTHIIRIWAGGVSSKDTSEDRFRELAEEAKELVNMAKKIHAEVSFEYHQNTLADSCAAVRRLLQEIPGSRTHWQHSEACSVEENVEAIRKLSSSITTIHVQHCRSRVYYPLQEGEKVWLPYLRQLNQLPGEHYACIEFVKDGKEEQFLEDAHTLRAWIHRD